MTENPLNRKKHAVEEKEDNSERIIKMLQEPTQFCVLLRFLCIRGIALKWIRSKLWLLSISFCQHFWVPCATPIGPLNCPKFASQTKKIKRATVHGPVVDHFCQNNLRHHLGRGGNSVKTSTYKHRCSQSISTKRSSLIWIISTV